MPSPTLRPAPPARPSARVAVGGVGRSRLGGGVANRLRRALRLAPVLIGPWTVAAFLAARLSGVGTEEGGTVLDALVRSVLVGVLIGAAAAWLESGPLARWGRRFPLWAALTARTLAYAAVLAGAMAVVIVVLSHLEEGMGLGDLLRDERLPAFLTGAPFWTFAALLLVASFVINFALQVRRVLGPETLWALFVGRYRRPRHEERAFAFLDLTDSTAWAERLGPLAFTDFKNDFFADVAEPVLATGGRIVQYVGDEVMVSWPMRRAEKTGAPLRFFFLVEDRVGARAERYRRRYGAVPQFKAGLHGGWVVTAEVGDLKRDIVHSGDVVNTASRIEGECRPRGHRLLVSAALLDRLPVVEGLAVTELGAAALRGKAEPVGLCAVERAPVPNDALSSSVPLPAP